MSDQTYLVGTGSDKIYTCRLTADGQLSLDNETTSGKGPSWLISRHGLIYATNEPEDQIEVLKMNEGKLVSIKKISAHGSAPCSLDIDSTGQWLAVANYGGLGPANFALFKLDKDHLPDEKSVEVDTIDGHGPHPDRQDRSHCHQVQFYENHLYGIDLGTDTISVYQYKDGLKLSQSRISTQPGAGPRHLLFDRRGGFAYLVNELNSTTTVYQIGSNFELLQSISTRDSTSGEKENTPAELHLTADGKYLLVSNRGDDNVVVYSVDQGSLKIKEKLDIRGLGPRFFTFDPTGQFLLIANKRSNNMTCLRYDSNDESFRYVSHLDNLNTPQHILFL